MGAAKLPSLCFQFPLALLFFLFSPGSDEEEFLDVPDDTGFTRSRSSLSFSLIFPQYAQLLSCFSPSFLPLFPDPAAVRTRVYVTAAELSSLERPHLKMEQGEWVGEKERKKKCHVILHWRALRANGTSPSTSLFQGLFLCMHICKQTLYYFKHPTGTVSLLCYF